jgi:hypothetical protein
MSDPDLEADFRLVLEAASTPPPDASGWGVENLAARTGLSAERIETVLEFIEDSPSSQLSRELGKRAERNGNRPFGVGISPHPSAEQQPQGGNDSFPV